MIDGPPRKLSSLHSNTHPLESICCSLPICPPSLPVSRFVSIFCASSRLVSSRVTLTRRARKKAKQRDCHKQLSTLPLTQLHPIRMFAWLCESMCVCVYVSLCVCVILAWLLAFLLHKLSFEWLSVTLALLKCSASLCCLSFLPLPSLSLS